MAKLAELAHSFRPGIMNWFRPRSSRQSEQQQQQPPRPRRPLMHMLFDPFGLVLRSPQRPPPAPQPTDPSNVLDCPPLLVDFLERFLRPGEPRRQSEFLSKPHYREVLAAVQAVRPETQQQFDAAAEAAIKAPQRSREQIQAAADAVKREQARDQASPSAEESQGPAREPASRVPELESEGSTSHSQDLPKETLDDTKPATESAEEPVQPPGQEFRKEEPRAESRVSAKPSPEPAEVVLPKLNPTDQPQSSLIPALTETDQGPDLVDQLSKRSSSQEIVNRCITLHEVHALTHMKAVLTDQGHHEFSTVSEDSRFNAAFRPGIQTGFLFSTSGKKPTSFIQPLGSPRASTFGTPLSTGVY